MHGSIARAEIHVALDSFSPPFLYTTTISASRLTASHSLKPAEWKKWFVRREKYHMYQFMNQQLAHHVQEEIRGSVGRCCGPLGMIHSLVARTEKNWSEEKKLARNP